MECQVEKDPRCPWAQRLPSRGTLQRGGEPRALSALHPAPGLGETPRGESPFPAAARDDISFPQTLSCMETKESVDNFLSKDLKRCLGLFKNVTSSFDIFLKYL